MNHVVESQEPVFALLADPASHGGQAVKRVDTHAAVVFLARERAFKVKRAVRFPFLDFSTLDKRKAACETEIEVNPDEFPPETVALAMSGEDANTYQFVYVLAPSRPSGGGEALALGEALQRRAIQAERARAEAEGYVRTLEERLSETEQRLEGVQKSETEARERLDARERELREQAGAREHELREQLETIERELRDRLAEVDRLHEAVRYAKLDIAVKDEQLASLQAELAPLRRRLDRAEELLSYARHRLVERASKTTKRIPLVHRRLKRLVEGIGTRYR